MIRRRILWAVALILSAQACEQRPHFNGPPSRPDFDGLAPPSNAIAKTVSSTEIDIAWVDNSFEETDFRIDRIQGTEVETFLTVANVTSFHDSGLKAGTAYSYFVYSIGPVVTSVASNEARATTFDKPKLSTIEVTNINSTTSSSGGVITSNGGTSITIRGVCWSINTLPSIDDSKTDDGSGSEAFTSLLTNLTPNTTYYMRSYATNSVGTAYGNQILFTTLP